MPAWVPARLSVERMQARLDVGELSGRASDVVEGSTIIGLDIDGCPPEAWQGAIDLLPTLSAVAHTSPSDGATPGVRKGRIFVQLAREVPPADIWPLRQALATALGVREWLDDKTKDPSRIFFAGRLTGTPARDFHSYAGEPLDPSALLAAVPQATTETPAPGAHATTTRADAGPIDFDPVAALAELLGPALEHRGHRHAAALALGAALAKSGLGWSDAEIEQVVRRLPSDDPDARVLDALAGAARARRGEPSGNWSSLADLGFSPHVVVAAEGVANLTANRLAARAAGAVERAVAGDVDAWGEVITLDADLYAPIPPVHYICERLMIAPGPPSIVAGYGGLGKTMLVQLLVVCAAAGLPFLGSPVRRCRVLHLDHEQGKRVTMSRYKRLAVELGATPEMLRGQLAVVPFPRVSLVTPGIEDALAKRVAGFDLVVIDSLRAATPGLDENKSDIRAPLDMLARISDVTGVTFIVIHHARKPSDSSRSGSANQEMRGNSAINDAAQSVIMLEPPPCLADETPVFNGFRVICGKVRDGKRFDAMAVAVEDTTPRDAVPFPGLRLVIADAAAKTETATATRETMLRALIRNTIEGAHGGQFTRGKSGMWDSLGASGYTRSEVFAMLGQMIDTKEIVRTGTGDSVWKLQPREP